MRRGMLSKSRHSQAGSSPESSMRSGRPSSRDRNSSKGSRSHSYVGRDHSPKRGPRFIRRSRSPRRSYFRGGRGFYGNKRGRGYTSRRYFPNSHKRPSPYRRRQGSPRRSRSLRRSTSRRRSRSLRRSESPRRSGSRRLDSPRRSGSPRRPVSPRRTGPLRQRRSSSVKNQRDSPPKHTSQSSERRSFSSRSPESRNRSNARSQSSGGRQLQKARSRRQTSSSPISPKKQRISSPTSTWHPSNASSRKKDLSSDDHNVDNDSAAGPEYRDGRIGDKPHNVESRKNDNLVSAQSQQEFPHPRDEPHFNNRDIDERYQRRSLSPFRKDDRFIDEGTFRESGRAYQNDTLNREQTGDGMRKENFTGGSNRVVEEDDFITQESNIPVGGSSSGIGQIYTKEELKKITVDIYRPIPQESMSAKRSNFDPKDVVIVRRSGEGARPIFDRDEIKQAQAERTEGAFLERRVVAIVKENRSPSPRMKTNLGNQMPSIEERENFQINSEHFNHYGQNEQTSGSTRPSLNDRWQRLDNRNYERNLSPLENNCKGTVPHEVMDSFSMRDSGREFGYDRNRSNSRSCSPGSRQYQSNRFVGHQSSFSEDRESRRYPPSAEGRDRFSLERYDHHQQQHQQQQQSMQRRCLPSLDLRHNISTKRKQSHDGRSRSRFSQEKQEIGREWCREFNQSRSRDHGLDRRSSENANAVNSMDVRNRDGWPHGDGNNWDNFQPNKDNREDSQGHEKLPNFSSRPDKYRYQVWLDKPDEVPKGPSYYEHDTRGDAVGRGRSFGVRGRGRGGTMIRGRGNFRPRGGLYNHNYNSRNKWSPHQWKHDRFETSPDRRSE